MDTDEFIARHPSLLHLAHFDSWPSIQRHGLLSAEQIVQRWGVDPDRADSLLSQRRAERVILEHPELGRAVLRDQHPLSEERLAPALTGGMTVPQWLRLLNRLIFFFPTQEGLEPLHAAYRGEPAVVLKVRTRTLVHEHGARVRLAGINTGNTQRRPAPRGADTFLSIRRYDHRMRQVKEVAVMDEVPDLCDHLLSAELRDPDGTRRQLEV